MKQGQGGKGDRWCFAFSGGNTYDSSSCSNRSVVIEDLKQVMMGNDDTNCGYLPFSKKCDAESGGATNAIY